MRDKIENAVHLLAIFGACTAEAARFGKKIDAADGVTLYDKIVARHRYLAPLAKQHLERGLARGVSYHEVVSEARAEYSVAPSRLAGALKQLSWFPDAVLALANADHLTPTMRRVLRRAGCRCRLLVASDFHDWECDVFYTPILQSFILGEGRSEVTIQQILTVANRVLARSGYQTLRPSKKEATR